MKKTFKLITVSFFILTALLTQALMAHGLSARSCNRELVHEKEFKKGIGFGMLGAWGLSWKAPGGDCMAVYNSEQKIRSRFYGSCDNALDVVNVLINNPNDKYLCAQEVSAKYVIWAPGAYDTHQSTICYVCR